MVEVILPKARASPRTRLALLARIPAEKAAKPEIQLELLRTLIEAGDYHQAQEIAERLIQHGDADADVKETARKELAWVLFELGNYDELLVLFDHLSSDSNNLEMFYLLTRVQIIRDDHKSALDTALKCMSLAPNDPKMFVIFVQAATAVNDTDLLFEQAKRAINNGHVSASVLSTFVQAGRTIGDNDADSLAKETLSCIADLQPDGHRQLQAINHELVYRKIVDSLELIDAPKLYASRNAKRLILNGHAIAEDVYEMFELAADCASAAVEKLDSDNPFANSVPETVTVSSWATVYTSGGYESIHVHPDGWYSGVYYPSAKDAEISGHLCFGFPPFGQDVTEDDVLMKIKPQPGRLILFPSYLPHWTEAPTQSHRRVSLAFDLTPSPEVQRASYKAKD